MLREIRRRAQTTAASISARLRSRRTSIEDEGPRYLENRELMPVSAHGASPTSGKNESAVVIGDAPQDVNASFSLMEPNASVTRSSVDGHGASRASF